MLKVNKLYNMDCRKGLALLDDESIDCCISSPPYWSLRDYGIEPSIWDGDPDCKHKFEETIEKKEGYNNTRRRWQHGATRDDEPETWNQTIKSYGYCRKCGAWKGCLGLEPDINLFIKHLCDIYDLVKQKLKKSGTCWVNLGDTYGSGKGFDNKYFSDQEIKKKSSVIGKQKCLLLIPQRFAIEMTNRGWILRNVIIWQKPNCMPTSANDRFTVDFEYLYFFVKNKKYWFEQQRENSNTKYIFSRNSNKGGVQKKNNPRNSWGLTREEYNSKYNNSDYGQSLQGFVRNNSIKKERDNSRIEAKRIFPNDKKKQQEYINYIHDHGFTSGLGRNKRCIWRINTKPNPENHFATFPSELVEIPIKSGCPEFICRNCSKPKEKILEKIFTPRDKLPKNHKDYRPNSQYINQDSKYLKETSSMVHPTGGKLGKGWGRITEIKQIGWTECDCNAGYKPGVVLDPFAGTGTTLREAFKRGRDFIGFEISKEYCKIANKYLSKETNYRRITEFISNVKMEDSV